MPDQLATAPLGSTQSLGEGNATRTFDVDGHPTAALTDGPPDASVADRTTEASPEGFRILREIARGGMGRILTAHDLTLDREVAIKVLLPGASTADGTRRFIRESKITARLPHPGIPPVYALGTLPNGRPFLAMKLIRGRTLADDLAARTSLTDELPRFLQTFEQVCQAVGFAHSQGVIHRDLKPANIMVGAFGEVQVMDWGLSKRLLDDDEQTEEAASTEPADDENWTRSGAVMGTPAYMPPEQARGDLKYVDARADVFSLGAILCEMLTGQRAFLGKTSHEVLKQAAEAGLAGAFERLDAAGADPELIAVAKRCLAASPADRPADAVEVAKLIADHRAGVEARLRKAEADRAAAAIEVQEQRKRRRIQLALAAAVLLLMLGGGAYAWTAERRASAERERQDRNATAVESLLDRADDALRADDAPAASMVLAEAGTRLNEGGTDSLRHRYERSIHDRDLLAELDEIDEFRWRNKEGGGLPWGEEITSKWVAVFARIGVRTGLDAGPVVEASIIRQRLLRSLDMWLMHLQRPERPPLFAMLSVLDPDPYRTSVRRAWTQGDSKLLLAALDQPDAMRQPAGFAVAIGRIYAMPVERRKAILIAACAANPRDFGLHMETAQAHAPEGRMNGDGAVWYRAAAAIRPHSVRAWAQLGLEHSVKRDFTAAIPALEKAVALDPNDAATRLTLATAWRLKGELNRALEQCREAVRLRPKWERALNDLSSTLLAANDPAGALAAAQAGVEANPTLPAAYMYRSQVEAKLGNHVAALASIDQAIRLSPNIYTYHLFRGNSNRELKRWKVAAADYAEATRQFPPGTEAWFQLGWASLNAGDRDGAIRAFTHLRTLTPNDPWTHGNLGIAYHGKGNHAAAADCYREVVRLEPRSAKFRNEYGMILLAKGDPESAALEYRIALQLEPGSQAAKDGLARARAAMKK